MLSEQRGTPVFRMLEIKAREVDAYVRHRKELHEKGKVTAATLQADISALKKIEAMVIYRYGNVGCGCRCKTFSVRVQAQ